MRTTVLSLLLLFMLTPMADAHSDVEMEGDANLGSYAITFGWEQEPAYSGVKNAVFMEVNQLFGMDMSDLMSNGDTYAFTFTKAGDIHYHCHVHPMMQASVMVMEGPDAMGPQTRTVSIYDDGTDDMSAMGYLDETSGTNMTMIHEGDTVVWTNIGTLPHNVGFGLGGTSHDMGTMAMDSGAMDNSSMDSMSGHGSGSTVAAGDPVFPVLNLDYEMMLDVEYGGQSLALALRPVHGQPGQYVADMTPTAAGTYTAHLTGLLGEQTVDLEQGLDTVYDQSTVRFPATAGIDSLAATSDDGWSTLGTGTQALVLSSVVLGVAGLAVAIVAVSIAGANAGRARRAERKADALHKIVKRG